MLIGCCCWEVLSGTGFLAGDDSVTGCGSTPPELEDDCVKSTTGIDVKAGPRACFSFPCKGFGIFGLNLDVVCVNNLGFDMLDFALSYLLGRISPFDEEEVESWGLLLLLTCFGFDLCSRTLEAFFFILRDKLVFLVTLVVQLCRYDLWFLSFYP